MTRSQEPRISPDLYKQTLQGLTLRKISLDQVQASCNREPLETGELVVNVDYEAKAEQTQTSYFAFITYFLQSERAGKLFMSIQATYRVSFDAEGSIPKGFFEVFQHLNLRLTTMPYFRELVASTTGRMEVATLTLPYDMLVSEKKNNKEAGGKPVRKTQSKQVGS